MDKSATEKQIKTEPKAEAGGPIRPKRKYRSRARLRSPETVQRSKVQRRSKANDRERNRMHGLNDALEDLRCALPALPEDGKLTKIETLRMAHNYILTLTEMLKMPEGELQEALSVSAEYHVPQSADLPQMGSLTPNRPVPAYNNSSPAGTVPNLSPMSWGTQAQYMPYQYL